MLRQARFLEIRDAYLFMASSQEVFEVGLGIHGNENIRRHDQA